MKTLILTLIAVIALTAAIEARSTDKVTLRTGQQKTIVQGDLTIKFIAVLEDSRCPANAQCIWAGNARIKIKVSDKRGGLKVMEINTNSTPQSDQFGGYEIKLTGLTQGHIATLSVEPVQK